MKRNVKIGAIATLISAIMIVGIALCVGLPQSSSFSTTNKTAPGEGADGIDAGTFPVNTIETSWESFHGNQQHTGYYLGDAPDVNKTKWVSEAIEPQESSSTTVGEGKLFVYCSEANQGYIAALDVDTGAVMWREKTLLPDNQSSWATPVYHDGLVFTSGDGARAASNGSLVWGGLPGNTNGGPLVADGKVYIGNWDGGKYFCYDEKTGALIWEYAIQGNAQGTPSYDDGKLYLTSWSYNGDSYLYCLNAGNGTLIWKASPDDYDQNFCGSATISEGTIFLTTYNFYGDGGLYCIDGRDGTIIWRKSIQRSDSTPAIHEGKVYVTGGAYGFTDRITYCFNATSGALVWETSPNQDIGGWTCSPVVAGGKVFAGRMGEGSAMSGVYTKLFALDQDTGKIIWEADGCGGNIAVSNGVVFSAGSDGRVHSFGAS